jgi:phospholipase/lecithinase/hemolysin
VVFSSATAVALPPATFADLVHLGAAGHRFVAEQLLQVFDDAFDLRSPA